MAKILVVEDEGALRELIIDELNDAGHSTLEAGNGQEGLDILARETPDLIVSDITMPTMNGYQFLRSVREKHAELARTPFLFMTALSDRESELKGLRLGVDDYLTKPIDFDILIARIDSNLRHLHLQAILEPADSPGTESFGTSEHEQLEPTASNTESRSPNQSDPESIEKLSSIVDRDNGHLVAGKFRTLSLEQVRARVGDRWPDVSDRILRNAEQVIREHLSGNDVFHVTSSQDFLVCFAELSSDEAAFKVDQIRDCIWERLFGETQDEGLATASGDAFEIALDPAGSAAKGDLFSQVEAGINDQSRIAKTTAYKSLQKIYSYEDLEIIKLLGSKGSASKIKRIAFKRGIYQKIRHSLNQIDTDSSLLISLQSILFERLNSKNLLKEISGQSALILPVEFSVVSEKKSRSFYLEQCKKLEGHVRSTLITEFVDAPDRIAPHAGMLRSIVGSRKLQFLEIRRLQQIHGLDLAQLHVVFVSMGYDHVMQEDSKHLSLFRNGLKNNNIKFYLKEIPEGKLIEAQNLRADLYSGENI